MTLLTLENAEKQRCLFDLNNNNSMINVVNNRIVSVNFSIISSFKALWRILQWYKCNGLSLPLQILSKWKSFVPKQLIVVEN